MIPGGVSTRAWRGTAVPFRPLPAPVAEQADHGPVVGGFRASCLVHGWVSALVGDWRTARLLAELHNIHAHLDPLDSTRVYWHRRSIAEAGPVAWIPGLVRGWLKGNEGCGCYMEASCERCLDADHDRCMAEWVGILAGNPVEVFGLVGAVRLRLYDANRRHGLICGCALSGHGARGPADAAGTPSMLDGLGALA